MKKLLKEWETEAGLTARVYRVQMASLEWCCGYVRKDEPVDENSIRVHGGITFSGTLEGTDGNWIGFDLMHFGDDEIPNHSEYAEKECESLAKQLI